MFIHAIPDKLEVTWNQEVRAIIDTWSSYSVQLEEFREAILNKGLAYAAQHGGRAWIVDSSHATGALPQSVQEFISAEVFPAFAGAGIRHFLSINATSPIARIAVSTYTAKVRPCGLTLVEPASLQEAIEWLRTNP